MVVVSHTGDKRHCNKTENEMRLWIHKIWLKETPYLPLPTCGPRENKKLEALIKEHGEMVVARAWFEFVTADPHPYKLDDDETGAATRYPLSVFLSDPDSYIVVALLAAEKGALTSGMAFAFEPAKYIPKKWSVPETESA